VDSNNSDDGATAAAAATDDDDINNKRERVKSFPSHKAHRAALMSVSLALSQTPAYTARPWIQG